MKKKRIWKVVLKNIVLLLALILCVSFIAFWLMDKSPIDPLRAFVARNMGKGLTPERKAILIKKWGLDQPFFTRYVLWLKNASHFDFGESILYNRPVIDVIREGFSSSFTIILLAWILQGLFGVHLGIVAGTNKNSKKDKWIKNYCILTSSTPSFWIALLFIMLFAIQLKWFPVGFSAPIGVEEADVTWLDRLYHMVLPVLTLVFVGISDVCLHTREKVLEMLNSEYALFAKARGMKKKDIVHSFGLKNILLPAITIQFASISELFSGIVLTETAFNYPGLGKMSVAAGLNGDVPLILGIAVFSAVFVYVGNRIADLLYIAIDPRLKESKVNRI